MTTDWAKTGEAMLALHRKVAEIELLLKRSRGIILASIVTVQDEPARQEMLKDLNEVLKSHDWT